MDDDGYDDGSDDGYDDGYDEGGDTAVVHLAPDLLERKKKVSRAYLIVLTGPRVGEMASVEDGLTIGRSAKADLQVQEEGVSRMHAKLRVGASNEVIVADMGSSNGTYLNSARVDQASLQDGDKIQIGTTTILKFSHTDELERTFQQQMYKASLMDSLTGLFNRRYMQARLESELSYTQRHRTPLCLIMLDLDHFKSINDTYGHLVGDEVLAGLGELLMHAIRCEDLAVRYGGEEFVVICRGIDGPGGVVLANRLCEAVRAARFVTDRPEIALTISAGVVCVPHPTITGLQELIDAADKALYQAKAGGRDRACAHEGCGA